MFSFSDSSLLQDNVAFVLCLDTVGNGDSLHLHVSKPPKEGTPQYSLLKELEMVRTSGLNIKNISSKSQSLSGRRLLSIVM